MLQFCTEHDNVTAMLFAKLQNGWTILNIDIAPSNFINF